MFLYCNWWSALFFHNFCLVIYIISWSSSVKTTVHNLWIWHSNGYNCHCWAYLTEKLNWNFQREGKGGIERRDVKIFVFLGGWVVGGGGGAVFTNLSSQHAWNISAVIYTYSSFYHNSIHPYFHCVLLCKTKEKLSVTLHLQGKILFFHFTLP